MITNRISRIILPLAAAFAIAMPARAQETGEETVATPAVRLVLYDRGDMGSNFWRIPALVTTNDGSVLAVADKRNDSNYDLPNLIDLTVRRSTDNGMSWSNPHYVVKADEGGGYGDAALAVHKPSGDIVIVAAHGAGLWDATPEKHQHLVVIRSQDDGLTWSKPLDITKQLYDPKEGISPIKAVAGFATSGAMLCDDQGRLMFVLVANATDQMWGPLYCYLCISEDGGYTWKLSELVDDYGDESKVVQLVDGTYLMSIRNRNKAGRKLSRSDDGIYWTRPIASHQLIDPACNGDLIALTPDELAEIGISGYPQGVVLHSFADDPKDRKNVSVYASDDLGVNWRKIYTVTPDRSSYSALAVMPDGDLGIFSEEDNPHGGFRLWFTKVSLKDLLNP